MACRMRHFKRELVLCCVSMLNAIPRRAGISQIYSPRELVTGKSLNFAKHCKIAPGEYCLVHEDNLHTNTMEPRAKRALAIGGANNMQGSHRLLMLGTGSIVTRRSWTPMKLTDDVKARVHEEDQHMEIDYLYRGTFYKTGDADEDFISDDEISIGEASEDASGSDSDDEADEVENDDEDLQQADANVVDELDPLGGDDGNESPEPAIDARTARRQRRSRRVNREEPTMPEEAQHPDESDERATNDTDDVLPRRSARVKKKRLNDPYEYDRKSGAVFMQMVVDNQEKRHQQMSLKKGLRMFGERGKEAVRKEIISFKDFDVLEPILAKDELTYKQKLDALPLMMSLKEKRTGEIKGRGLAGGHKDRGKIPPGEATAPAAITESLYITSAIDAFERRFVGLLDIPLAYLHARTGHRVTSFVELDGILVDLYLQVDPSAASKVHYGKNGKKRLYTKMNKALLYGHIMSGRLFWEHISKSLTDMGFIPNPDDLCVLNKDVNGEQCTIVLHVDDIGLSHKEENVVRDVAATLEKEDGSVERYLEPIHAPQHTVTYLLTVNMRTPQYGLNVLLECVLVRNGEMNCGVKEEWSDGFSKATPFWKEATMFERQH